MPEFKTAIVAGIPLGLCLLGKISFSYISLTKWLDCSSGLSLIYCGVDEPLRKKRGSITYQAIFAG